MTANITWYPMKLHRRLSNRTNFHLINSKCYTDSQNLHFNHFDFKIWLEKCLLVFSIQRANCVESDGRINYLKLAKMHSLFDVKMQNLSDRFSARAYSTPHIALWELTSIALSPSAVFWRLISFKRVGKSLAGYPIAVCKNKSETINVIIFMGTGIKCDYSFICEYEGEPRKAKTTTAQLEVYLFLI